MPFRLNQVTTLLLLPNSIHLFGGITICLTIHIEGCLGCFQFGINTNKAAVNIHVQIFLHNHKFSFPQDKCQIVSAGSFGKYMFSSVKNYQTDFLTDCVILLSPVIHKRPHFFITSSAFDIIDIFILAILMDI
jgi:hypothetical protein